MLQSFFDSEYYWFLYLFFRNENSPDDLRDYRRVWFELTAPTANIVLLCVSTLSYFLPVSYAVYWNLKDHEGYFEFEGLIAQL